jgi:ribosomal protein S18 acetylase RimI-like enzyme
MGAHAPDSPGRSVAVRAGTEADAAFAGALHAQAIADGYLSALGPRFLELLYRRVVRSSGAFLLVADTGDTATGFIAGALSVGGLYRDFLLHDGVRAVAAAPLRLLRSLPRAVETLRYGSSGAPSTAATASSTNTGAADEAPDAELLSVAVAPAGRGQGVGRLLVGAFQAELAERGVARAHVVVGADNATAIALYRGAGFTPAGDLEVHPGTHSLRLAWSDPGRSPR